MPAAKMKETGNKIINPRSPDPRGLMDVYDLCHLVAESAHIKGKAVGGVNLLGLPVSAAFQLPGSPAFVPVHIKDGIP